MPRGTRPSKISVRRGALVVFAFLAVSCASVSPLGTLPPPDADLGLGDVVMLTWTTRSHEGILGHAFSNVDAIAVDSHRQVALGEPRFVATDQTLELVVAREQSGELGGGYGVVSAKMTGARTTHVAYRVRVTGYLELVPGNFSYNSESGCCLNGEVAAGCGDYYVVRLMRGTGTAEYLQQLSGSAQVSAADVVRAKGGEAFRRLSTSKFTDTFFAYEVVPLSGLCAPLSADAELAPLSVAAPDNCYLTLYFEDGTRASASWSLPTEALCQKVSEKRCKESDDVLDCQLSYSPRGVSESSTSPTADPSTAIEEGKATEPASALPSP